MSWIVKQGSCPVYKEPADIGRIEDILPYGTVIKVQELKEDWAKGEQGWIKKKDLTLKNPKFTPNAVVGYRGAYLFPIPDTEFGPIFELPFEVEVQILEEYEQPRWVKVTLPDEKEGYIQRSQLNFSPPKLQIDEIIEFSQLFLGIKYLWGGTTSFGYDCSGFTQMLYRQAGVLLPRNSYQQYEDIRLEQVQQGKGGDLIFFKNASFQVVHVGMLIDTNHFVHAFTKEESWICNSPLHDSRWSNGHFYHGFAIKRLTRQQTLKDWT